jgi:Fe-S-cluster-containing dehydrogenase component
MVAVSRRQFIRISGVTVGGLIVYGSLPTVLWLQKENGVAANSVVPTGYQPEMHQWAMVIDVEKCIGCRRCLSACKNENHVPEHEDLNRTWLERYTQAPDGTLKAELITRTEFSDAPGDDEGDLGFYVPKLCNQCSNPPCVSVCPVHATFATSDGVILMDNQRCIGCKYCAVACPYGARYLNPETMVIDKCTFCYHRITKGLMPACVEACPKKARSFGDLKDTDDPVRQRLLAEALQVIKPSLGTKPRVYYGNLREGVH